MAALSTFPLEGDGIIENLFYYLWCKDELDNGPAITIPDTIIYKYRQPAFWYFTAKDGHIRKKHKGSIVNVRIEEAFCRKATGSDIVAYYISTATEGEDDDEANPLTTIEYFNRETFHDFLYNREKVNNGIVQRFVEPKGVANAMIRAIWSPKVCLLERRTNNYNLQDKRYGMYERAVTYEGAEFYSHPDPVRGSLLPQQVQGIVEAAVAHIAEVSFQKYNVSRLVANFKVDSHDRVTLLWASSLRLEGETFAPRGVDAVPKGPVNIDTVVRLPRGVRLGGKHFDARTYCCPGCGLTKPKEQRYPVPYRTVITHFEQLLALLQRELRIKQELTGNASLEIEWPPAPEVILAWGGGSSVGFPEIVEEGAERFGAPTAEEVEIPPVLRKLHPRLTVVDYRRYKNDPLYMFKTTTVCEDCTLVYAEVMNSTSIETQAVPLRELGGGGGGGGGGGMGASMSGSQRGASGRLPASAWDVEMERATRETRGGGGGGRKAARRRGPKSTASRLQLEVPMFPDRVESAADAESLFASRDGDAPGMASMGGMGSMGSMGGDMGGGTGMGMGGDMGGSQNALGGSASAPQLPSLKDREEAFFKDLYRNPNLQQGHPLSHLIAAEAQTKQAESAAPVAGGARVPRLRRRNGARGTGAPPAASPYNVVQKVVGGLPKAEARRRRQAKANRPALPVFEDYRDEEDPDAMAETVGMDVSAGGAIKKGGKKGGKGGKREVDVSESAVQHREFLLSTLQDVQQQLENPPPLLDEPQPPPGAGASASAGGAGGRAGDERVEDEGAVTRAPGGGGAKLRMGRTVEGEHCLVAFSGSDDGTLQATVTHVQSGQRVEVQGPRMAPGAASDDAAFKDHCASTLEGLCVDVGAGQLAASFRS